MQPEARQRIRDAISACQRIEEFTAGLDYVDFSRSVLVRSATERQREVIGEALNKASSQEADLNFLVPEIPRIVGLRNRLIHGYDAVDDQLIWDIVRSKIVPLRQALDRLL